MGALAYAGNPSYLGSGDQEAAGLRPALGKTVNKNAFLLGAGGLYQAYNPSYLGG
jgi:hypothetical protein